MSESDVPSPDEFSLDSEDVVTVGTLNSELATVIEDATSLHHDYVVGDVTDCRTANGHVHFDLVDDGAAIHCVVFGFRRDWFDAELEADMRVAVSGDLSFYEAQGSCSILVTDVVPVGESESHQAYEEARAQLAKAGLLDSHRKQALPELPGTVGLITSADSDAATDAVTAIRSRFPEVDIALKHASVQGPSAIEELLEAISVLDRDPEIDVLVLTRGGGADKTLQVFNDPALCRVIAETDTPICVGIGHEDDRTLADDVADKRVMTPTHAGEVVPERELYEEQFETLERSLSSAYNSVVNRQLVDLDTAIDRAYNQHVSTTLTALDRELDHAAETQVATRVTQFDNRLDSAYNQHVTSTLTALNRDLDHAADTRAATRLTELDNQLDSAYQSIEQATTYEQEKEAAVEEAKQEAATAEAQQRRRYLVAIAILLVLLLGLLAYIVI